MYIYIYIYILPKSSPIGSSTSRPSRYFSSRPSQPPPPTWGNVFTYYWGAATRIRIRVFRLVYLVYDMHAYIFKG